MPNPLRWVGEQLFTSFTNLDISRTSWFGPFWGALRSLGTTVFFRRPIMEGTVVNYDLARALYRNDHPDYLFGSGFARPIIDLSVDYMGLPSVSNDDTGDTDAWLNDCIRDHWAPQLQQLFRDACRDSKVIVRFRQPRIDNPLYTEEDRMHGRIEVIPPEHVDIIWSPVDPEMIDMAVLTHDVEVDMRDAEEIRQGRPPRMETHEIQEIITPDKYSFYDKTADTQLVTWSVPNTVGFVPLYPIYNEYAADLGGGQSDLEAVIPFLKAFHEVMVDVLSAHKYHSIPKTKFNVKSVDQFIKNNWPSIIDPATGKVKDGATIDWKGKEIMFLADGEDAGFIEATSVLGDSKVLLDFLLDCIAIASETPKWALLATDNAIAATDASTRPFEKKIERKRVQFSDCIVVICKMALASTGKAPETQRVSWPPVNLTDLAAKGQAIQQLIMGFDVAVSHEWISDLSVVKILAQMFPEMMSPELEMEAAKDNVVVEAPASPASATQALPPAKSTNGTGSKTQAKKALATTTPSQS